MIITFNLYLVCVRVDANIVYLRVKPIYFMAKILSRIFMVQEEYESKYGSCLWWQVKVTVMPYKCLEIV